MLEEGNRRGLERIYGVGDGMFTRVGIGGIGKGVGKGLECNETRGRVDGIRGLGRCRGVDVDVIHVGKLVNVIGI